MFIYEKNKRNSETGKTEQTLNITFEGNKPVDNPDVVIDKDGVTGIKSDSNAYGIRIDSEKTIINSYSIDGEEVKFDKSHGKTVAGFTKSFEFFVIAKDNTNIPEFNICAETKNGEFVFSPVTIDNIIPKVLHTGSYIIDMENKIIHFPAGAPTESYDMSTYLSQFKNIFGFVIGHYGA